jgi:hypothetical protein
MSAGIRRIFVAISTIPSSLGVARTEAITCQSVVLDTTQFNGTGLDIQIMLIILMTVLTLKFLSLHMQEVRPGFRRTGMTFGAAWSPNPRVSMTLNVTAGFASGIKASSHCEINLNRTEISGGHCWSVGMLVSLVTLLTVEFVIRMVACVRRITMTFGAVPLPLSMTGGSAVTSIRTIPDSPQFNRTRSDIW